MSDQVQRLGVAAAELGAVKAALEACSARLRVIGDALGSDVLRTEVARLHTQHGVLTDVENALATLAGELGTMPERARQTIPARLYGASGKLDVDLLSVPDVGHHIQLPGRASVRVTMVIHEPALGRVILWVTTSPEPIERTAVIGIGREKGSGVNQYPFLSPRPEHGVERVEAAE